MHKGNKEHDRRASRIVVDIRRPRGEVAVLGLVALAWLALGALVLARFGDDRRAQMVAGAGWLFGCLVIVRHAALRVWASGDRLRVRNTWRTHRFHRSDIESLRPCSVAGGRWVVELRHRRGVLILHACDRANSEDVRDLAGLIEGWLVHATPSLGRLVHT